MNVRVWVDLVINDAISRGGSDIHFEPYESGVRVRYRVHGKLWDAPFGSDCVAESVAIRIKGMAKMDIAEKKCASGW